MTKRRRKPGSGAARPEVRALAAPAPAPQVLSTRPVAGRQSPRPSIWAWTPYNNYTELSFDRVVSILKSAEQGFTEQWADLAIRMRSSDDHLYSVCETRINAVAGAKWKLNPGTGESALASRAADDCERVLRGIPSLKRVFRDILDGVYVGWSVLEIIWEPRGDEWLPVEVVWLHPRRFRFAEDFSLYLWDDGRAAQVARETGAPVVESRGASGMALSPNKYIVHVPRAIQNYPTSSGALVTCVRPWWVKQWVTKFWLSGAEVAGNPRYIATAPQATPDNVFEALHEGLEQLAADGVAAFREGVQVSIQAPLAQGSGSVWQQLYDNCNAGESKAILGSTLNVEIGETGGAYAAAESQGDVTITPRIAADADAMWETIARDLLRPYLFFNRHRYGGVMPPVPRGETIFFEAKAEVDELVVGKGACSWNELRQSRGLEAWTTEQGGDQRIPAEMASAAPSFDAPDPTMPAVPAAPDSLPDVAESVPVEKAADAALNGAQVESLLEIVSRVASGQIPRATGINLITAAFPLTPEQAEKIMGPVGAGFVPTPEGEHAPVAATQEAPAALPLRDRPWDAAMRMATSSLR